MSIVIDTVLPAEAGVPRLTNYASVLADDPKCVGLFDFAEAVVDGAGRILSVPNLKTGGLPLVQATQARQPQRIWDAELRRPVALFDIANPQNLVLDGYTWAADKSWTIAAICLPTAGNNTADIHQIAGDFDGTAQVNIGTANAPTNIRVNTRGTGAQTTGVRGWNRVIGSCLSTGFLPDLQVNGGAVVSATVAGSTFTPNHVFKVGHTDLRFGGKVAAVAFFAHTAANQEANLLNSTVNADLLTLLNGYFDEITGGAA